MNLFSLLGDKLVDLVNNTKKRQDVTRYLQRTFAIMQSFLEIDISLEIGAHEAQYSREVRNILPPDVPVLAFEASPNTYRHYAKELILLYSGIEYLNLAFADKNKDIDFFEYYDANAAVGPACGYSSLYERTLELSPRGQEKSMVKVAAVAGSDFLAEHYPDKNMMSLWIDVEGAQAEVLQGLEASFKAGKIACVFIEVESVKYWPEQKMMDVDVAEFLIKHQMSAFGRDNEYVTQFNMVFIRNDLLKKYSGEFADLGAKYLTCINNLL